ncbi:MAG: hypothetical protein JRG91_11735 [Deltaproteobacteria bacterium]|nr:hypothetical protein [Deltaproteobacteria bacterium]
MNPLRISSMIGVIVALVLTAGCGDVDKNNGDPGIGDPCNEDSDCPDGQSCFDDAGDGFCTEPCADGACPEGTVCVESLGEPLCLPECDTDEDCGEGMACVDGVCHPACETDEDCNGDYVCEYGGCVTPTTVLGEVYDSETLDPIEGARVVVMDNDTMAAAAPVAITDERGMFSQRVVLRQDQGSMGFTLRVAAEGYMPFPDPPLRPAIPDQVIRHHASDVYPVALIHDAALEGLGSIAGTVTSSGEGVGGMLIVATGGAEDISTVTDVDGTYVMLNVPDATWDVSALQGGMTRGEAAGVEVAGGADVTDVDMDVTLDPAGSVSGSVNHVAGGEAPSSVVLFYPGTQEAVPGLRVMAEGDFIIDDVPDGEYDVYATYDNDCNVLDPDPQLAHTAIQHVTVSGAPVELDTVFNITNAISMTGVWADEPCVHDDNTITIVTYGLSDTPVFTWEDYPGSTQGYAIEVLDVFGNVVWGGFDTDGAPIETYPNHTTETTYAGDALVGGYNYRWTLWAMANDSSAPLGFRFISTTENLRGLFEIRRPIE